MADKYEFLVDYAAYDKSTIDAMYNIRFCGMPVSLLLLDRRKTVTYCHMCACLITLAIPNSKVIQGNLTVLDGDEHLWVELDDTVYDTSDTLMWDKDCYYKREGVLSSKVLCNEEVHENIDIYLNNRGYNESFVCWIEDLENNLDNNIYGKVLREHIDRFKEEIGYDSLEINQEELETTRKSLQDLYDEISGFKTNNPVMYKRKDD